MPTLKKTILLGTNVVSLIHNASQDEYPGSGREGGARYEKRGMNEIASVRMYACARNGDSVKEGVREGEATRVGSVSSSQVIGDLPSTTRYLGPSTSLREQVGRCWARRHLDHLGIAGELRPRYRDTRRSQEAP